MNEATGRPVPDPNFTRLPNPTVTPGLFALQLAPAISLAILEIESAVGDDFPPDLLTHLNEAELEFQSRGAYRAVK
jgi:hypothetical protein